MGLIRSDWLTFESEETKSYYLDELKQATTTEEIAIIIDELTDEGELLDGCEMVQDLADEINALRD